MKMRNVLLKLIITASWLSVPAAITAQGHVLALKHGLYVQSGTDCKDAPFAAMKSWNGVGFRGPHESQCTSRVVARHGSRYEVVTACSALGDGTPNPSGKADEETLTLQRLSDSSFVVWNANKPRSTYRWCSAQ